MLPLSHFYCTAKFLKYIYKEQRKPETPAARVCELTVWIRWGLSLVWQLLGLSIHCTGQHSLWTRWRKTGKKKTPKHCMVTVCFGLCVFSSVNISVSHPSWLIATKLGEESHWRDVKACSKPKRISFIHTFLFWGLFSRRVFRNISEK